MDNESTAKNEKASLEKRNLTELQMRVLNFIKSRYEQTGVPPSYREIQQEMGYKAVGTVQDHVQALVKKGHLEPSLWRGEKRRARGLVPKGYRLDGVKRIPIYGEIAAGSLRQAEQLELGSLYVAASTPQSPTFALRVVGDSMIEVGIFEGDFVIVVRDVRIKHGDIVVALLEGETTVKRYEIHSGQVFLVPANKRLKPMAVEKGQLEIQGKVVGLQRMF